MSMLILVATLSLGQVQHFEARRSAEELAAIPAAYPATMVDSTARPGFNGRLWLDRPIIGGMQVWARESGSPGAEAYGAFGLEDVRMVAQVEGLFPHTPIIAVEISPWDRVDALGPNASRASNPYTTARRILGERLEASRAAWLKDQGFTGGVRTFMNDTTIWGSPGEAPEADASGKIEPAGIIELPADMPRRKGRLRVDATPGSELPDRGLGPISRVSLPAGADPEVARRLTGGDAVAAR